MNKSLLLTLLFLLGTASAQQLRAPDSITKPEAGDDVTHQRRELFSFWNLLFFAGGGCPPGPAGHKCRHKKKGGGNYQTGAEAHYDGGGSSSSGSYSSSSSYMSGGDGGGSASTKNTNVGSDSVAGISAGAAKNAFIMLIVAVVAAAVAAMAIVFGQRKTNPEAHPLTGSVARRQALFGAFADSALCADGSAVEMSPSSDNKSALV